MTTAKKAGAQMTNYVVQRVEGGTYHFREATEANNAAIKNTETESSDLHGFWVTIDGIVFTSLSENTLLSEVGIQERKLAEAAKIDDAGVAKSLAQELEVAAGDLPIEGLYFQIDDELKFAWSAEDFDNGDTFASITAMLRHEIEDHKSLGPGG